MSLPLFQQTVEVPVTVDIEQTPESLHAYAVPEGIEIQPGDSVLVHGAPSGIPFGERALVECRATVTRAGWLTRRWTRFASLFELTQLYEVGFQPQEELHLQPREVAR